MTTSESKRILIADSDHESRTMMGLMLVGEGYEVSHAVSGSEAVALHARKPHHLIITELDGDGFQVLSLLRGHSAPVKFIAIFKNSRFPDEICRRMCEQLGAHCVMVKPVPPEQLLAAVRSALN
jgi:DNA-binding response OmpR family regulator